MISSRTIALSLSTALTRGADTSRIESMLNAELSRAHNKQKFLERILSDLEHIEKRNQSIQRLHIHSAHALSSVEEQSIAQKISTRENADVSIDDTLGVGFRAVADGREYDATLKTLIDRFRSQLLS